MADFNEVNTDTLISYTTQNLGMGSILIVTTDPALSSVTEWDKSSSLSRFRVLDKCHVFMGFIQACTAGN